MTDTNLHERFPVDVPLTPEAVRAAWERITTFNDGRSDNPESPQDGLKNVMQNMQNRKSGGEVKGVNKEVLGRIEKAKNIEASGTTYEFDDKEVILYNLSLGAKRTDLKWVFEGNENFEALPTFGMLLGVFIIQRRTNIFCRCCAVLRS